MEKTSKTPTPLNQDGNPEAEQASNKDEAVAYKAVLKIPYIGKPSILYSKRLKSVLDNIVGDKVRIVYSTTKIKDHFRLKDPSPKELQTNVVYRFQCLVDPNTQYVGYTNRTLRERVKEHVGGGTRISDHIGQCTECSKRGITTNDFSILKKCRKKTDTPVFEALFIKRINPSLNKQLIKPGYTHQLQIFN